MIKVMIVDDEPIVREDIRGLIDWREQGCEIVAEAGNGAEGYSRFMELKPDIVFSDIRMPIEDGFAMIQRIVSDGAACEIILLTGYDEFAYARRAMELNLNTYLLKHEMTPESLLAILQKTKAALESRRRNHRIIRGNMFRELLTGQPDRSVLSYMEAEGLLQVRDGMAGLILFQAEGLPLGVEEVFRLCADIPGLRCYSVIEDNGCRTAVVKLALHSMMESRRNADELGERAGALVHAQGSGRLLVLFSDRCGDLRQLHEVYAATLEKRALFALVKGRVKVFAEGEPAIDPLEPEIVGSYCAELRAMLGRNQYLEAAGRLRQAVSDVAAAWDLHSFTPLRAVLEEELDTINRHGQLPYGEAINALRREENAFEWLSVAEEVLMGFLEADGDTGGPRLRRVLQYIDEAYAGSITLRDIAQLLDVGEFYAGQLFKKQTGKSFKAYLADVRVEKAKQLLATGRYRIHEVGELVGYQTTQYFCKVFKEKTGKNPGDYR